ncbi:MAG TPA: TetR family transcriptional regulator [Mycobacterium sp.]|nr:TetR family transcriptional regulator [Mycobacterium sp.]
MTSTFQRARRPEQMAVRRAAIMDAARALLAEKGVTDISLRELSDRVGLAKSNVLRYFDSREAVFLELLDEECQCWLSALEAALGKPRPRRRGYANEIRVGDVIAASLADARLLCELLGAMAGVLERNITTACARDFKARAVRNISSLALLVDRQLPWLGAKAAAMFAEGALMLAAGMYPFAIPTEPVRTAMAEMDMPDPRQRFVYGLREGLVSWLIGAAARAGF